MNETMRLSPIPPYFPQSLVGLVSALVVFIQKRQARLSIVNIWTTLARLLVLYLIDSLATRTLTLSEGREINVQGQPSAGATATGNGHGKLPLPTGRLGTYLPMRRWLLVLRPGPGSTPRSRLDVEAAGLARLHSFSSSP
ncbi:hypothetical protein B0T26DRAFT_696609 [Lasiosphaeria miniovina]|uniref:Uncharacterized protein n=1 Tax=Lasiosphaeria miniovina TaxID=1954250 RepID=A0AA40EA79_9PEZI|nr:uncharacterized protein B0T26DRAFT_696609 [Lasiosphaeria miniovina]KAK0728043.1 hypothetical protein B0T26DRAFT_696609 [Lasiosphaeria miniovina]